MSIKIEIDETIISALKPSAGVFVLGGAGISKESGIPTFRDAQDGLWAKFDPEELASMRGFRKDPKLVMDWYAWRRKIVLDAMPNRAHQLLAAWEKHFSRFTLVTQNVDGLHQKAGSRKLVEMHGSIHRMKCVEKSHPSPWIEGEDLPRCATCNALLRPDIVWFGEALAAADLKAIDRGLHDCDVFLAIGTSGQVYPAAGLLDEARRRLALTIVINPDESARGQANFFLKGAATEAMAALSEAIGLNGKPKKPA